MVISVLSKMCVASATIVALRESQAMAMLISSTGLWIFAAAAITLVISLYISKRNFWLVLASIFVFIFQFLILMDWSQAKYLTIINGVLLISVIIAFQRRRFYTMVKAELVELFDGDLTRKPAIQVESLRDLPPIVQKWLIRSNVIGNPPIQTLYIKQKGEMRTKVQGKWLPFEAEQFINANNPGFIWNAAVRSGFAPIYARDKFIHDHGNMLIKGLYTIPIADSSGPEIDQGTLMRFLAEIIWFPTAALAEYIRWEYVSDTSARATIDNGITSVSGIFTYDANGDIKGFEGMRYRDVDHHYALERWLITVKKYRIFGSFRIASDCEVAWHGEGGVFTWLKIALLTMKFNDGKRAEHSEEFRNTEIRQQDLELK